VGLEFSGSAPKTAMGKSDCSHTGTARSNTQKKAQPARLRLSSTKGGGFGGLCRTIAVQTQADYLLNTQEMQAVSIAMQKYRVTNPESQEIQYVSMG